MVYVYTCSSAEGCGHTFEESMSAKDWVENYPCPKCGKKAHQNLVAQHASGGIDSQMGEYEFYSSTGTRMYAASYLDNQIGEARKIHPGTDFIRHNNCWLPRIKNRTHRKKYLKEMDYIEKD